MIRAIIAAMVVLSASSQAAHAVNVTISYDFDSNGFFTNSSQARDAIEAAAAFYSNIINDSLSPIETPAPFSSETFDGSATWEWRSTFLDPSTGNEVTLSNQTISADEYRVYVGARSLGGNTLGEGGFGGSRFIPNSSGGFTDVEWATVQEINDAFSDAVLNRGQPADEFARWGGFITFDNDSSTTWHFDRATEPSSGESDFFSVALHELGHALGFGGTTTPEWQSRVTNANGGLFFTGSASTAEAGGPPRLSNNGDHWEEDTVSTVFGTNTVQETAFDPTITIGTRKLVTSLDVAALIDLGWEITEPDPSASPPGDYNGDRTVNAADYASWRDTIGGAAAVGTYTEWAANFGAGGAVSGVQAVPEPAAAATLLLGVLAASAGRGPRRVAVC